MAGRDLLSIENNALVEQNNGTTVRGSARGNVVGDARIMSYSDLSEAQCKRDEKEATGSTRRGKGSKESALAVSPPPVKRMRLHEVDAAEHEIVSMGLQDYCSVLQF